MLKKLNRVLAGLLTLLICLGSVGMLTSVEASAADKYEYVAMTDEIRTSISAYANTYAANQASSSAAVLTANKNSMMPVRSSGNCATFVSSSLAYAGIPYDNAGSSKWQQGSTISFAGAKEIGAYLAANNGEGNGIKARKIKSGVKITSMSSADWSSLKVGDVVCMTMSGGGGHAVIVVQQGSSMESVMLASSTRDGIYNFKFWRNSVSKMDIYRIDGYYRTSSTSSSKRIIHKTGQYGASAQVAYLKNKSTGAALTTQGYEETSTGNVAYSLQTNKYYPGLDVFSSVGTAIKAQSKRIMILGIAHTEDSVDLFNAKLGLSGSNALKSTAEAVSATQLAVWVAQGQLTLSSYNTMGTAGTRVLAAVNTLLNKTKNTLDTQSAVKLTATSGIKMSVKNGSYLAGPFQTNAVDAYTVAVTNTGSGAYTCNNAGGKKTVFKSGESFYVMIPAQYDAKAVGVRVTSARYSPDCSAWQEGSAQPLALVEVEDSDRNAYAFGVTVDASAATVTLGSEPAGIDISSKLSLNQGEKKTLAAKLSGPAAGKTVTWKSEDKNVATVSSSGVVNGVGVGTVKITATAAGVSDTCTVTVSEAPLGISLKINSKKAVVNGSVVTIDANGSYPFVYNSRTVVPMRFTSEKMGAKVKWTSNSKPITITYNGIQIKLTVGSKTLEITQNGKTTKKTIDQAALLKNGRVYVPLRAVAENLGFTVKYDANTKVIVMTEGKLSSSELSERIQYAKSKL